MGHGLPFVMPEPRLESSVVAESELFLFLFAFSAVLSPSSLISSHHVVCSNPTLPLVPEERRPSSSSRLGMSQNPVSAIRAESSWVPAPSLNSAQAGATSEPSQSRFRHF